MRPEEKAAADLVARVTGATVVAGPVSGRHDTNLVLPSGRTIGLEVTQAADRDEVETWAAIAKCRGSDAPALRRWWQVGLTSGFSVKEARAQLPALLAKLEAAGAIEHRWLGNPHHMPSPDARVRDVEVALDSIGVDHAHSVPPPDGAGGLAIVAHKDGGPVDGGDLIDAVVAEAMKPDNRSKLTAMTADEHHLFVWVDFTSTAAHAALGLGVVAFPDPDLPPEVGTLWVAARHGDDVGRDWIAVGARRWKPPGPWTPI